MTDLLAIDPGNAKSAWCVLRDGMPVAFAKEPNEDILERMASAEWCGSEPGIACIEMMECHGMAVGKEVFETVWWTGRFCQAWPGPLPERVFRGDVKMHICGRANAKDANIRQALIDRYGGDAIAVGGKKCGTCHGKGWRGRKHDPCGDCYEQKCADCGLTPPFLESPPTIHAVTGIGYETPPGVLHGLSGHCWSALAVGVTYLDSRKDGAE